MLRSRILTAIVLGPPVIAAALLGGIWAVFAIVLLFGIGIIEYRQLLSRRGFTIPGGILLPALVLFCLDRLLWGAQYQTPILMLAISTSMVWALIAVRQEPESIFLTLAFTLVGLMYLAWSGAHFIGILQFPSGTFWTITALLLVWSADIGAYAVGNLAGKHLLLPKVSPKKTWEGYLAGIVASGLAALLLVLGGQAWEGGSSIRWTVLVPLGLLVGALSPAGDLLISVVKRYVDAKDAGKILPGHGGLLDRLDSIFVSGLLTYYFLLLFVFGTQ